MLTQICQYLRNWFERDRITGTFSVADGELTGLSDVLQPGQYYRIIGSVFNDGVHRYGENDLTDETEFSGAIWPMSIPPVIVELAEDIAIWTGANQTAINSPYASESFGGYSYSLKSGNAQSGENGVTWQSQFSARLSPWRKI